MRNSIEKLFVFQFEKLSVFQLVDDFEYSTPLVDLNIILLPQHSTAQGVCISFKFQNSNSEAESSGCCAMKKKALPVLNNFCFESFLTGTIFRSR
jgi:hypothetical protein